MKRFHSPYISLHHLRRQEARLAEMDLASRIADLRAAERQRADAERAVLEASQSVVASQGANRLVADLLCRQQHVAFLEDIVTRSAARIVECQKLVEAAQADVVEKRAGAEVVGKLLDRDRQAHRRETLQQQQHQIDEFGIRRIFREAEIAGGTES